MANFEVNYDKKRKLFIWIDRVNEQVCYANRFELMHLIDLILKEGYDIEEIYFNKYAHFMYAYEIKGLTYKDYLEIMKWRDKYER